MFQTRVSRPRPLILGPRRFHHLPDDIIRNILARLPVKSLLRFRCVCKTWNSLITSPIFISTHLNNNNDHDHDHGRACLIQIYVKYNDPKIREIYRVLCVDHTFDSVVEYSIPSAFDSIKFEMVSSCNGLVCLAKCSNPSPEDEAIYLWNPSIRKFKRLPSSFLCDYLFRDQVFWVSTGFAYQSKTNDYKVVKLWSSPVLVEVYTLSSDSWRKVEISLRSDVVVSNIDHYSSAQFVSGVLHWLGECEREGEFLDQNMILSFDVDSDKFGVMALPDGDKLQQQSLFAFKGNLAFITYGYPKNNIGEQSDSQCFIWVIKDYGVHESLNKLISIRFENVDISFYGCTGHGELLLDKEVKEESSDDEIKIHYCNESTILSNDTAVVWLDLETLPEMNLGFPQYVTHVVTTFRESLVLLDGATEPSG